MTHLDTTVGSHASQALPIIRKIRITDLKDALAKGIEDFWAVPTHAIFLSIIYPVAALVLAQLTLNNLVHLFFPLAAGFALIGPVAALALDKKSPLRRAASADVTRHSFRPLFSRGRTSRRPEIDRPGLCAEPQAMPAPRRSQDSSPTTEQRARSASKCKAGASRTPPTGSTSIPSTWRSPIVPAC
jgi:hypothetical protein